MHYELVYLILGIIGLWIGAELTTRGSISIAKKLKISYTFIGLTILAIGTDLPELFINVTAALQKLQGIDTSGLIIGETVGTVISQTTFILGLVGLFGLVVIVKREFLRDGLIMIGAAAVMFLMSMDGQISMMDGLILLIMYIFYFMTAVVTLLFISCQSESRKPDQEKVDEVVISDFKESSGSQTSEDDPHIEVGMKREDVIKILGEPKKNETVKQEWAEQEKLTFKLKGKKTLIVYVEDGGVVGVEAQ